MGKSKEDTVPSGRSTDAKHLATGRLKLRRSPFYTTKPFSSLQDVNEVTQHDADTSITEEKYAQLYAADSFESIQKQNAKEGPKSVVSNRTSVSMTSGNPKSLSADDFVKNTIRWQTQPQLDISAHSGEGHCSGVCAFIPVDIRPLVKKAYENTDFAQVDPEPVCLPMLGDDGILRRDYKKFE